MTPTPDNPVALADPVLLPAPKTIRPTGDARDAPTQFRIDVRADRPPFERRIHNALAGHNQPTDSAHPPTVTVAIDPAVAPHGQGYQLLIAPDRIDITGHDEPGCFYGAKTLVQLVRQYAPTGAMPCLTIDDRPDIPRPTS